MKTLLTVLLALLCIVSLTACTESEKTEYDVLSDMIGNIDISRGEVAAYTSQHELTDKGTTYGEVIFPDQSFRDAIQSNKDWKALPMSNDLAAYIFNEDDPLIPAATNGYYYFRDRHPNSTDAGNESQFLTRDEMHYMVAVYNTDTQTLYIYVYDT